VCQQKIVDTLLLSDECHEDSELGPAVNTRCGCVLTEKYLWRGERPATGRGLRTCCSLRAFRTHRTMLQTAAAAPLSCPPHHVPPKVNHCPALACVCALAPLWWTVHIMTALFCRASLQWRRVVFCSIYNLHPRHAYRGPLTAAAAAAVVMMQVTVASSWCSCCWSVVLTSAHVTSRS
jgi:hypothetical protein